MSEPTFQRDADIAEIADAYSLDAVDVAARNFGITLDGSEQSICQVEQMLGRLHEEMRNARPPEEKVWTVAKTFGSYVGEVLRRHHNGEWGVIDVDGQLFPGLKQADGGLIWPWSKAHKRLTNGSEDSIWHYYQVFD